MDQKCNGMVMEEVNESKSLLKVVRKIKAKMIGYALRRVDQF